MPSRAKSSAPTNAAILRDAFAAPPGPEETLEESFRSAVLEQIVLPPLSRGERWRAALGRMGIPVGGTALREKLAARRMVADLRHAFGPEGGGMNHPAQLAPYLEGLLDIPDESHAERSALESSLAGLLIEYRYKYSLQRGLMCYYSKIAKKIHSEGLKQQRIVSKVSDDGERVQMLNLITDHYLSFIRNYYFACLTREDILKGESLFADFISACLFLARITDGGALEKEPDARRLPLRDHLLFLAMRDPVTVKAAANETYQRKMSAAIKDFPQ